MKKFLSLVLVALLCASLLPMAVAETEPVTLDLFVNFTWWSRNTWEGYIPEMLTKNGGVFFDVTVAADDGQLGLMIASGELPDLVFAEDVSKLSDPELCYSYDELIEKYNIDWQPDPERIALAKTHNVDPDDDHFYTIIQNYNTQEEWKKAQGVAPGISGLYFRKDIWEELGCPPMNTLDEILNVFQMVKDNYPDMYPLNAGNSGWRLQCFRDWIAGGNTFQYVDDQGTVKLRDELEGFYNFLKFVNGMYRKGYFPLENLALTNESDARQQMITGKTFSYEHTARPSTMEPLDLDLKKTIPDGEISLVSIPDDAGKIQRANAGWAGVFISRNCKDPEAAIKMLAYMNTPEAQQAQLWGRPGIDYTLDESGAPVWTEEYLEAKKQDDFKKVYGTGWILTTTEMGECYMYYAGVDDETKAIFTKNLDKLEYHPELALAEPVSGTDEAVIESKINTARGAEIVKIYTAETDEEFEAAYQNWMGILKQIGVEQLDAYMTARAAELKAQFGF